jgi:hypothetical protein
LAFSLRLMPSQLAIGALSTRPGSSATSPSTPPFWVGDYGGGVPGKSPFVARRFSPKGLGVVTLKIKQSKHTPVPLKYQ